MLYLEKMGKNLMVIESKSSFQEDMLVTMVALHPAAVEEATHGVEDVGSPYGGLIIVF